MIRNFLLSLFLALYSCVTYADPVVNQRLLYLQGEITGQTIAPLKDALEKAVTGKGRAPITIVINSPGGSVIAGMAFINRMQAVKALDMDINCYVLDVAASMAFQVLTQCTNRYTLPTSFLLWHGVRMGTRQPITTALARSIADDLQRMDEVVLMQLDDSLSLSSDVIRKHFEHETLWSGVGLHAADPKFITPLDSYPRLLPVLNTAVQMGEENPFQFLLGGNSEGLISIWSGWQGYTNGRTENWSGWTEYLNTKGK